MSKSLTVQNMWTACDCFGAAHAFVLPENGD